MINEIYSLIKKHEVQNDISNTKGSQTRNNNVWAVVLAYSLTSKKDTSSLRQQTSSTKQAHQRNIKTTLNNQTVKRLLVAVQSSKRLSVSRLSSKSKPIDLPIHVLSLASLASSELPLNFRYLPRSYPLPSLKSPLTTRRTYMPPKAHRLAKL